MFLIADYKLIKNFEQFLIAERTQLVLPVAGTAMDLLKKAYRDYDAGRYQAASIKYMMAFVIMLSYNPYAAADRGFDTKNSDNHQPGLLHTTDGDVMMAYHFKELEPLIDPPKLSRKEKNKRNMASQAIKIIIMLKRQGIGWLYNKVYTPHAPAPLYIC